jgi:hypothetical protein
VKVIDMLRVIWDDDYAIPHRDVEVIETVQLVIDAHLNQGISIYNMYVNQMTMILAFQLAVKQKKINYKDIVFVYNDEEIKIDQNGNLEKWPFPDVITDMLLELA